MIVPIQHTRTETVPINDCWPWYVFAKIDGWNAWMCMQEQDYIAYKEEVEAQWRVAWFRLLGIVGVMILIAVWIWIKDYYF